MPYPLVNGSRLVLLIVTDHFTQLQEHRHLPYFDFKEIVIELFKSPDLTHTRLKELMQIKQNNDETPEQFMNQIRKLTEKAFRHLPDMEKQTISVAAFCQGLKSQTVPAKLPY